ncbi:MAG: hypothetical protein EBQ99_03625 [Planctomycetes bacterium]|nr:hypothetical protein [Planctomycetota bacterium]
MIAARARWLTPSGSSALALLQLHSRDLAGAIGAPPPAIGGVALRTLAELDACVLVRPDETTLLVTPHGGPRIRQRLGEWLISRGVVFEPQEAPWHAVTEDPVMRRALEALPRAASDEAVPLLLAQAERWRRHGAPGPDQAERSRRLQRLVDPPLIALAGPPNAGKSSLLNALVGRTAALASPEAGTTRDHVTASVALAGLTCTVMDAPGLRDAADPLEAAALARAGARMAGADLVVALAAPGQTFIRTAAPCLRVRTMRDLPGQDPQGSDLAICAPHGEGLEALGRAIRERLVPAADLASDLPFDFR